MNYKLASFFSTCTFTTPNHRHLPSLADKYRHHMVAYSRMSSLSNTGTRHTWFVKVCFPCLLSLCPPSQSLPLHSLNIARRPKWKFCFLISVYKPRSFSHSSHFSTQTAPKMRLHVLPAPLLALLSAFVVPSTCLPVAEEDRRDSVARFHAIRPRETYSVVPIDGGSSTTQETTTVSVITTATQDITVTATPTSSDSETTKTVTETDISVVPVETTSPVTIIETQTVTAQASSTTSSIISPSQTSTSITPSTTSLSSPTSSLLPSSSSTSSVGASMTTLAPSSTYTIPESLSTLSPSSSLSVPVVTQVPTPSTFLTSTTTSYDNGQWHTTYPAWNGTALYTPVRRAS